MLRPKLGRRTKKYMRSEERRRQIVEMAYAMTIEEGGFTLGLSPRTVAKRLNIAYQTVQRHYPNRRSLIMAVREHASLWQCLPETEKRTP